MPASLLRLQGITVTQALIKTMGYLISNHVGKIETDNRRNVICQVMYKGNDLMVVSSKTVENETIKFLGYASKRY